MKKWWTVIAPHMRVKVFASAAELRAALVYVSLEESELNGVATVYAPPPKKKGA